MIRTEAEWDEIEDRPESYAHNRKLVEAKFKKYFEVFKYDDYTKELILHTATKTYERGLRWSNTPKFQ